MELFVVVKAVLFSRGFYGLVTNIFCSGVNVLLFCGIRCI